MYNLKLHSKIHSRFIINLGIQKSAGVIWKVLYSNKYFVCVMKWYVEYAINSFQNDKHYIFIFYIRYSNLQGVLWSFLICYEKNIDKRYCKSANADDWKKLTILVIIHGFFLSHWYFYCYWRLCSPHNACCMGITKNHNLHRICSIATNQ